MVQRFFYLEAIWNYYLEISIMTTLDEEERLMTFHESHGKKQQKLGFNFV